jgi:precorrin-2 methylase
MTDIHIVGLGVNSIHQLTREAGQAIRASNEVLYLDTGVATRRYLAERCDRVTSLFELSYREGDHRLNAYYHMAATVIDAALDHAPVTFAVHGHPTIAVYAPFLVADMAKVLGLTVDIQAGVSAMDTVFAALKVDPCIDGMQMYEATDLLLRRRPLQADVPALIWQIGSLETRLYTSRKSRPERFDRFVRHLSDYYPPEHRVTAVYTPPHPLLPPTMYRLELARLRDYADRIHAGFSLFIPALAQRAIQDPELAVLVDDPGHLETITRHD